MVARGMRALQDQDVELAEAVINADDFIDELDVTIESECLRLIALQAPVGKDLHLLGTAIKAITDLERIADHSVDIAKVARKLAQETFFVPLVDLPKMADKVREMLKTVLTAFVSHDLAMVNYVVEADDQVDTMYHLIRDDLHNAMRRDPDVVVQASYLLFVAHYLHRTIIFPSVIRPRNAMPLHVMLLANVYCCVNGFFAGHVEPNASCRCAVPVRSVA